jgi:hypothetical protein
VVNDVAADELAELETIAVSPILFSYQTTDHINIVGIGGSDGGPGPYSPGRGRGVRSFPSARTIARDEKGDAGEGDQSETEEVGRREEGLPSEHEGAADQKDRDGEEDQVSPTAPADLVTGPLVATGHSFPSTGEGVKYPL